MPTHLFDGRNGVVETRPRTISRKLPSTRALARYIGLLILFASAALSFADTFTVNHTNQTGAGTLRQAILDANATAGTNVIQFAITNPVPSIAITNPLPDITNPVVIDGTTQPGFFNAPIVELNGVNFGTAQDGLRINTSNSIIRGLVINRFTGDGIEVTNAKGIVIEGNVIGLNVAGTADQGNAREGILLTNSFNCIIGGIYSTQRNVISGNTLNGVLVQGTNPIITSHVILGNYIGLSANGSNLLGNSSLGVYLNNVASNTVGGLQPGARNLISANSQHGVGLQGTNATGNFVLGNYIGLDVSGLVDWGNGQQGVYLLNAPANTVGGVTTAARNFISGNGQAGVRLEGNTARGNVVMGNFIGTDASGTRAMANGSHGVHFFSTAAAGNFIGGTNKGEPNLIAFNGGDGIYVQAGTNNALRANAIFSNTGLGIDIGADGVQVQDPGDPDSGANELQNFPFLTNATYSAGGVTINGSLNSRPARTYALDFFANLLADPATNGEGQVYLGSTNVTTGSDSNVNFTVTLPLLPAGRWISATATDTNGNTSEFSPCVRAGSTLAPQTFVVLNTNNSGAGSLRQALTDANNAPASSNNVISFAIPGSGVRMVAVFSTLPTIVEPAVIDGFTQSGSSSNSLSVGNNAVWLIRLDGNGTGAGVAGLTLLASSNLVRGLIITRFGGHGIAVTNGGSNIIVGNCIGVNENGVSQGNIADGIQLISSAGNRIGGASPADLNILSGNSSDGIELSGLASSNNIILGNYIGPDPGGTLDRRNSANGVFINGAPNTTIGGAAAGEGNLLVRNQSDGVEISGVNATNNAVLGNLIGTETTGTTNLGNFGAGVLITSNARFNFIGATSSGAGNRIAFNSTDGIYVQNGTNNAIRGNNLWSNSALGIDLDNDGLTVNDPGDPDTGANFRQNFPVITNAALSVGNTLIEGTLNSRPGSTYFLDLFVSFARDATTTNGEGQVYIGSTTVTTGADSNAVFSVNLPLTATGGRWITATATDTNGNTSEFSTAFLATTLLPAQTFTVINTSDSGPGSLREAIAANNATFNGATNLIAFAIPGAGPHVITPATALPSITEAAVVDGYTQTNANMNTLSNGDNAVIQIRLDGNATLTTGLRLASSNCTVRGLSVTRFTQAQIEIVAPGRCTVEGCFLGLDTDGLTIFPGFSSGVLVSGTVSNRIGGDTPAQRNLLSGMSSGYGVYLNGSGAMNNAVLGNFIGTERTGTAARPNNWGVYVQDGRTNVIGGTTAGARNVISGNTSDGINCSFTSPTGNRIWGNFIGTDVTGLAPLPNGQHGVNLGGSSGGNNHVGGLGEGEPNVIAYNGLAGIVIVGLINNALRANSIHDNGSQGIDLGSGGSIAFNDLGDGDGGANLTQNFPVLTNGLATTTNTTLQGTLNSGTNRTYFLDFYANLACESFGYGEGRKYLGATSVTTDGNGNADFNVTLPAVVEGRYLTATATDTNGNTSEFSACLPVPVTFAPTTFTVLNANDSGPGSLRAAILAHNLTPTGTRNVIQFAIPGVGPHIINLSNSLPTITEPALIDGYTQTNASPNTASNSFNAAIKVRLNGNGFVTGTLTLAGDNNVVRGLSLVGGVYGISISGSSNAVEGCVAGLDEAGFARTNTAAGIRVAAGSGNRIGGTTPAVRNVISGNAVYGVMLETVASNNVVQGNFIGTDFSGTTARLNGSSGVLILGASGNLVGGSSPGTGNLISGNGGNGVDLAGGFSNRVAGNLIGLKVAGTAALANSVNGVNLNNAFFNLVGGSEQGARNVISGNGSSGIFASTSLAASNYIAGNFIGTDVSGTAPVANSYGLVISESADTVGGAAPGEGNRIAFNSNAGLVVNGNGTTNVAIRANAIFANGGLGIDLVGDGFTVNDLNDVDIGPNLRQNYAEITNATIHTNATVIAGRLNSQANTAYAIDLFASVAADPTGNGEGQQFLGSTSVTTDGSGNASFNVNLPVRAVGRFITTTTTSATGNSSEFSPAFTAASTWPAIPLTVTTTADDGPGSLRQAMRDVALNPAASNNTIRFAIPGPGPHWITVFSQLPTPAEPVTIDGFTQAGSAPNTSTNSDNAVRTIILDGSQAGSGVNGLVLAQLGSVVRGLIIAGFGGMFGGASGIQFTGASNIVEGCFISGTSGNGITVDNTAGNRIGGATPAQWNTISGNTGRGVALAGTSAAGNLVQGNFIGSAPSGLTASANTAGGVLISHAPSNLIGGAPATRNLIGGNGGPGVEINGSNARSNRVQANFIGVTYNGGALSNNGAGVLITGSASNNIVGAPLPGAQLRGEFGDPPDPAGNEIAFNAGPGIWVLSGAGNVLRLNIVSHNNGMAVDLGSSGPLANDAGDADGGANNGQNFAVINSAVISPAGTTVSGTLDSAVNRQYLADVYSTLLNRANGRADRSFYVGSTTLNTGPTGNGTFSVNVPIQANGQIFTATVTDKGTGDTSEPAPGFTGTSSVGPIIINVVNANDLGDGSLRDAILLANLNTASGNDIINVNLPPGHNRVNLETPLPPITGPLTLQNLGGDYVLCINGGGLAGTGPLLNFLAPGNQILGGFQIVGALGNGIQFNNANNNLVQGVTFGGRGAGENILGDGMRFLGVGTGNAITDCSFENVIGDALEAPNFCSVVVNGGNFNNIGGEPLNFFGTRPQPPFFNSFNCMGNQVQGNVTVTGQAGQAYVAQLYRDLLNRPANPEAGGGFVQQFNGTFDASGQSTFNFTASTPNGNDNFFSFTTTIGPSTGPFSFPRRPETECSLQFTPGLADAINAVNQGQDRDPVGTFLGEHYDLPPPDLVLGGPMPLVFQRYYSSLLARNGRITGRLGTNWLHSFEMKLTQTNNMIQIVTAMGRVITFTNNGSAWVLLGPQDIPFRLQYFFGSGRTELADPSTQRRYDFDLNSKLSMISDGHGNQHVLTYTGELLTGISETLGRTLTLQYNGTGQLTNVTDGMRSVSFTQAGGLLQSVRDALGFITTYSYTNSAGGIALLTSSTRPRGNVPYRTVFNANGQVASQADALSNNWMFSYNGKTTTITDPEGENTRHLHSSTGELLSLIDEDNFLLDIGYATNGQRNGTFDRTGALSELGFHAPSGRPAAITNDDGTVTTFTYTNRTSGGVTFYDLSQVNYPDGRSESFVYDAQGNVIRTTDRAGKVTGISYNNLGQVLTATNPTGGVVTFTYDAKGNLATSRDSETGITTYQYDGLDRLTNVIHPDSSTARFVYDDNNRLVSTTDERGNTTFFAYDPNNNLTNATDAEGRAMRFEYDGLDRVVRTTDRLGRTASRSFDRRQSPDTITNRNGLVADFTHDDRQRMTVANFSGQFVSFAYDNEALLTQVSIGTETTRFGYDTLGYLTSVTNGLGQVTRFLLDALRRATNVVDALGRVYRYGYDGRGLLNSVSEPGVGSASYQYDALGNLTRITDLNGREYRFAYSPMGRLQSLADPLNRTNTYAYDARGRLVRVAFPDGSSVTNTYDPANSVTRKQFSGGLDLQFAYDRLERLTNVNNVALAYDPEGRLTNDTSANVNWGAAYDPGGRLTNVTYNGGAFSVRYTYDSAGRLVGVRDTLTGTQVSFNYNAASRLTGIARVGAKPTFYDYDAVGRLTRIIEGNQPEDFVGVSYNLNAVGEVIRADFTAPLNPQDYTTPDVANFTYDAAHQINSSGYSYDARGRPVASPGKTYAYDGASRLVGVGTTTFGYDGLGDLITRTSEGSTTRFFHHGALGMRPIVAERNEATLQFTRFYVWAPDGTLLYLIDAAAGNAVRFYHFDRVGTTLALTDAAGNVTDAYAWTPYGELLAHTGPSTQPFTYIGRHGVVHEPGLGLFHMRARWYDPVSARFLSPDPVWPRLSEGLELNPYQYVSAHPLEFIDPTGLMTRSDEEFIGLALANFISGNWEAKVFEPDQSQLAQATLGRKRKPRALVSQTLPNTVAPTLFNPDLLNGGQALSRGYGPNYGIAERGLEKLPYGFIKEFTGAAIQNYIGTWSVTSGNLNNVFSCVGFGDGCGAWRTWMLDWLNLESQQFKAYSYSLARIYMTSETLGFGLHRIIRFQWVAGGEWYVLDPWSNAQQPIWREDIYKKAQNANIYDEDGRIVSPLR